MGTPQQTIGIFACTFPGMSFWDPRDIDAGIAGSEEAIIYMAEELALLNYKVTVFATPPLDSPYSAPQKNPRYLMAPKYEEVDFEGEHEKFDIAISWRMPDVSIVLKKIAKQVYFWPHDTCPYFIPQPVIDSYDDVLWLSNWQREDCSRVNPRFDRFTHIFGNGIIENQFHELKERKNPYSCMYGSNYGRGLSILLDVWPAVKHAFPQATLDIAYGWKHWGLLTSEEEKHLREQIDRLRPLDVREHGKVSHQKITEMFEEASFWTYPCSFPETFCITALRAQYAGSIPIIIDSGALQETVRYGWACWDKDEYLTTLFKAFKHAEKISVSDRATMRTFIHDNFTWKHIAERWKVLFDSHDLSCNQTI